MQDIEGLWADFARPIETADDYIASLRGRRMNIYFMGERVPEPVDHPVIKPSINAMAETYRLASERPELGSVRTEIGGCQTNRFLHVPTAPDELVVKHEMQRELGRRTGTCFQRCVGLDAIGTCHSVTFDIDAERGTDYHRRFLAFLKRAQNANIVIGGAMTDPKGDRSKPPHRQRDLDLFLRVVKRDENGITVSGAKMHQTGAVNSHWLIFMPTMRMTEADRDWSVVGAVRVDAPGLTYVVGRQTNDTRVVDGGELDAGNARFAGQDRRAIEGFIKSGALDSTKARRSQMTAVMEKAVEDVKQKNGMATDAALQKALQEEQADLDQYKNGLKDQITILKLVNREVKSGVVLSEEEMDTLLAVG